MATFLFLDFDDFKSYAGGTVNQSVTLASLRPALEEAANTHIIPWLSQAQWDELEQALEGSPTDQQNKLLDKLKRAYALLTMYEHTATSGIQVSEAGIMRTETEEMKSAFKYQENQYRDWNLHTGYNRLENLLQFLNKNKVDYPTWSGTPEASRSLSLFINYAYELRLVYSKKLSRYTFEMLRPIMVEVEELAILPILGDEFYEELKTAIAAANLTDTQQKVVVFIQKAVAHFTVQQALLRHLVQLEGDQIVKRESLEPQSYKRKGAPSATEVDTKSAYENTTANRFISRLCSFLEANLDDYPTYKTFYEANLDDEEDDPDTDSAYSSRSTNSKIVRL